MEDRLLEDENVIRAEMWRAWEQRDKRHDKAVARKIKRAAGLVIGVLALMIVYYIFVAK